MPNLANLWALLKAFGSTTRCQNPHSQVDLENGWRKIFLATDYILVSGVILENGWRCSKFHKA
jgi:hypothetical protein